MTDDSASPDKARGLGGLARRPVVTIHDVARHAGVSAMTVSRVVNGQKYVSAAMRDKINAAIADLNYSPNLVARRLSGSIRIGALYSNPSSSNLAEFLIGAIRQSGESGCQFIIEPSQAHPSAAAAINKLVGQGVQGIILPPPLCDSAEAMDVLMEAGGVPLSFTTARPRADVSAVMIDDLAGARMLTRRLLALGHRAIGFVRGDPGHSPARKREEGFRAAMDEAGLEVDDALVVQGYFTYRSGLAAARALLEARRPPTAIFASNDDMAAAASAIAHGLGLCIPRDLTVVGFDDAPVATTVWPEITTIRQPMSQMAATAVSLLSEQIRRLRAGEPAAPRHELASCTLIERGSSAPARAWA